MSLFYLLMLIAVSAIPASTQSSETKIGPDAAEASDHGSVSILGGPSSVGATLKKD
jgi:hypothetical protein